MELEPERSSSASSDRRSSHSLGRPHARVLIAGLFAACLASSCSALGLGSTAPPTTDPAGIATVEWVIDGDTVDLLIDGNEERVRLIGIDAPESVSRNDPVQCFGAEASDALKGLLPPGTEVTIARDVEARDRFGRLLLYVRRAEDDLFVNRYLVETGFADAKFFEPNTSFEADFTRVRNEARAADLGLWGTCDGPDQPLE